MTLEIKSERRNLTFGSGEPAITHEEAINTLKEFLRAEQIAEMATTLHQGLKPLRETYDTETIAAILYEAGYRRQSDIINDFVNRLKEKPMIYRIPLLGLSTKTEIEDYVDDLLMQFRNAIDAVASQMKGGAE